MGSLKNGLCASCGIGFHKDGSCMSVVDLVKKPDISLNKIISLLETIIHNQELDLSDRRIIE